MAIFLGLVVMGGLDLAACDTSLTSVTSRGDQVPVGVDIHPHAGRKRASSVSATRGYIALPRIGLIQPHYSRTIPLWKKSSSKILALDFYSMLSAKMHLHVQ